jgi:hypothetical protein
MKIVHRGAVADRIELQHVKRVISPMTILTEAKFLH